MRKFRTILAAFLVIAAFVSCEDDTQNETINGGTNSETVVPSDAAEDALRELNRLIKEKTAGGELTSRTVTTSFEGGVYAIDCLLYILMLMLDRQR